MRPWTCIAAAAGVVGCGTGYAVDNSGTSSMGSVRAMGRREPNSGLAIGASRWVALAFVGRSLAAAVVAAAADSVTTPGCTTTTVW